MLCIKIVQRLRGHTGLLVCLLATLTALLLLVSLLATSLAALLLLVSLVATLTALLLLVSLLATSLAALLLLVRLVATVTALLLLVSPLATSVAALLLLLVSLLATVTALLLLVSLLKAPTAALLVFLVSLRVTLARTPRFDQPLCNKNLFQLRMGAGWGLPEQLDNACEHYIVGLQFFCSFVCSVIQLLDVDIQGLVLQFVFIHYRFGGMQGVNHFRHGQRTKQHTF